MSNKGYTPVQIDGIPEGFSYKKADINIDGEEYVGDYVAFIPNTEMMIAGTNIENLTKEYVKNSSIK